MRLLIVDDSIDRVNLIKDKISSSEICKYLSVIYCDSADGARAELTSLFDLLVLDVLIPKKRNGIPQAKNSFSLLSDVCNSRKSYIRPRMIIGLTADVDELGNYREKFEMEAAVVLRGTLTEIDWLDRLMAQIDSVLNSQKKVLQQNGDRALISVHGIRTYGKWQSDLSREVMQHSRSFEFFEIKYGFFDLFSFYIPYFRKLAIKKSAARLLEALRHNSHRDVYVIAHSFGTLITNEALKNIGPNLTLKGVFFCASPLSQEENIDHVVNCSEITLNECGTRDVILILSRIFVPGLGDAGRVGFQRENSSKFRNRYFSGGHGLYFKKFDTQTTFFEKFWMRFIAYGEKAEPFDSRRHYIGQDLIDLSVKLLSFFKPIFIPLFLVIGMLVLTQ